MREYISYNPEDREALLLKTVSYDILQHASALAHDAHRKEQYDTDRKRELGLRIINLYTERDGIYTPYRDPAANTILLTPHGRPLRPNASVDHYTLYVPPLPEFWQDEAVHLPLVWIEYKKANGEQEGFVVDADEVREYSPECRRKEAAYIGGNKVSLQRAMDLRSEFKAFCITPQDVTYRESRDAS